MGWVDTLEGSVVGLDTGPLIYYLEENPTYLAQVAPFFEAAARGRFQIVTSLVTLIEVLVRPLRENRQDLVRQYVEIILGSPHLSAFALNEAIAKKAAELRAIYNIRTPDAIQIATAMHAGAPWIFTSDGNIPKIAGISLLVVKDLPGNAATTPAG